MGRTKEEKREYAIKMKRERLTAAIQNLASSEGFRAFIAARRNFHNYSLQNQILIALQSPGSMTVAGRTKWRELGYGVRKGEDPIWIQAPVTVKDPENPDRRKLIGTKSVRVFSRDQVDPGPDAKPLDPPVHPAPITGCTHASERTRLQEWIPENLCPLEVSAKAEYSDRGVLGFYRHKPEELIWIDLLQPTNSMLRTMLHEAAHALRAQSDGKRLTTAQEECVVDVAACLAAAELGLDVEDSTIPYVATWASSAPTDALETLLPLADAIAKTLTDAITTPDEE